MLVKPTHPVVVGVRKYSTLLWLHPCHVSIIPCLEIAAFIFESIEPLLARPDVLYDGHGVYSVEVDHSNVDNCSRKDARRHTHQKAQQAPEKVQ